MKDAETNPRLQDKALALIARLREQQLRYATAGRVIESAKYALRANRVRQAIQFA